MDWDNEEDEYELTLSRFEAMLKTNKVFFFDSEEFESIVLHYLDTGKTNLAKKALKLGLEQHPESIELKLVQVEVLIYEGRLDVAEKVLNELYLVEPTNEEIYIQKATIYSKRGNHQKAVELLETALEHTQDLADVLALMGREYIIMDNLEKAKECFIKCLEEDSYDSSSMFNLVYCFDFLEQHEQAVAFLNRFVDKSPYNETVWYQLGKQYLKLKEYNLALRAFDFAIVIDEAFIGGYTEKARALQYLERYELAIESYKKILEIDSEPSSHVIYQLGHCYDRLNNYNLAIAYYKKAVVIDPLLEEGWMRIIALYLEENNTELALKSVESALDVDADNYDYWKQYANIQYSLGNYSEALTGYQQVVILGAVDIDFYLLFADLCFSFGELEKAVEALEGMYQQGIENAQIEYRLAGFLYLLDQPLKASVHLKNALTINFDEHLIFSEIFTEVSETKEVQRLIQKYSSKR